MCLCLCLCLCPWPALSRHLQPPIGLPASPSGRAGYGGLALRGLRGHRHTLEATRSAGQPLDAVGCRCIPRAPRRLQAFFRPPALLSPQPASWRTKGKWVSSWGAPFPNNDYINSTPPAIYAMSLM
ncbi:hypothetical protein B0J13DRAFT_540255 [Dactylonectria estremocensis]|uniref:Secreted protein n=1 Tax=Dactylonectria estremocensis TaxID=1079267 RepID=A0A9P9FFJ8_9HYPO|nr:hypothetical protein B0J13DRAFT_540255 [Dactylonectria estremocensis]